jgi:alkylhydroperoxidase/carboxymuconolactone decarboxylase family protein YurZ
MAEPATDTPVLDLLGAMTALSVDAASDLDPQTLVLTRIAALVASDAPPMSYAVNIGLAGEVDIEPEQIRGVLAAVAPIVGTSRTAAALGNIVRALALKELAEYDDESAS